MSEGRDSRGRFLPGVSGNPGGRASDSIAAIRRARELSLDAVERLWEIACDDGINPATRKDALVAILDRGLGRPRQSLYVDVPGVSRTEAALDELTDEELEQIIRAGVPELPAAAIDVE